MITKLMIIQKINNDGIVDVFQVSSDYFQWTFENRRAQIRADKEYFPFSIFGDIHIFANLELRQKPI
jgi:hypothetical protein